MSAPAALADLDVAQPGFYLRPDYFELLAWLRANDPVHRSANGMVLLTRYEDIREVSRRPDAFTSRRGALVNDPVRAVEPNDAAGSLLHLDPPVHADYRKLLNREFTPRAVARMEGAVRRIVTEAFDALPAGPEPIDLVEHLALPIPVRVIAELIGMAHLPLDQVRRWSDATIAIADDQSPEVLEAVIEFSQFLDGHVRSRFAAVADGSPPEDLISLLAASTVGDRPLTKAQVELFCMTLMVAGNETTRSLISGGAQVLAEHPDQRADLVAALDDPERADAALGAAVEELLRWVTPIQAFCRTATADVELGGGPVQAGDYVVLLYASGNRDEATFGATSDDFDVDRPATPAHLAFGFGEHLCLGAALARMEARMVFAELLRRHPRYEVVGDGVLTPSTLTRNLERLPVVLEPSNGI